MNNAIKQFLAGKVVSLGLFDSTLADNRQIVILAKNKPNKKTGHMIQLAYLDISLDITAINPDQPNGQGCDRRCSAFDGCYVQAFKFHLYSISDNLAVYQAGNMPALSLDDFRRVAGIVENPIRFGEFGDPTSISFDDHLPLLTIAKNTGWTGYSHFWATCDQRYKDYFMASVETAYQADQARKLGWRIFWVSGNPDKAQKRVECLFDQIGKQCDKCQLCNGRSGKDIDIVLKPHGSKAKMIGVAI